MTKLLRLNKEFYYFVFIIWEAWCDINSFDFEIVVENEIMKKS